MEYLESYIYHSYQMSTDEFVHYLANKYIADSHQKEIFLSKGVWLKVRLNYIAAFILTSKGKHIFSPVEIRETIREEIIPSSTLLPDYKLAGMLLTQDVHQESLQEYNNGYPCLKRIGHGEYKFTGFL